MDEPPELLQTRPWRIAVWALRAGYLGLAAAVAGLVALAFGATSWILAGGVIVWLATVPVTLSGFLTARHELPEPRPRLWSMRLMLNSRLHPRRIVGPAVRDDSTARAWYLIEELPTPASVTAAAGSARWR